MLEASLLPITAWQNFYVITGSSAGALTGLTFVVITLIGAAGRRRRGASRTIAAFNTPTVVHFGSVLLISAILSAPWTAPVPVSLVLGLTGLGGVVYSIIVIWRMLSQEAYSPVLEDWLWNASLPLVAYFILVVSAFMLQGSTVPDLFVIGGVVLLLLFTGIHNAWDVLTYTAIELPQRQTESPD
ncbi:MAG: hypothetical protein ACLQUY_02640 [Ktedonobacterales bacterium]